MRLGGLVAAALLLHLLVLLIPLRTPTPEPASRGIEVTLSAPPPATTIPISESTAISPPEPLPEPPEPSQSEPEPVVQTPPPSPPAPVPVEPVEAPQPSVVDRLSRYRLEGHGDLVELPPEPVEPRVLGGAPTGPTMAAVLETSRIELPFEDPDTPFRFYSIGWQGRLERGFDLITPEWDFRIASAHVRCAYIVVIVACGWD